MAEARSAVSYSQHTDTNILFLISDQEFVLRINKHAIPNMLGGIKRGIYRTCTRVKNRLINAFYPSPPYQWVFSVAAPAAVMTSEHPRLIPFNRFLWSFESRLPNTLSLPRSARIGIVSLAVGTCFVFCLSVLRRISLRMLLSYQGWMYEEPRKTSWTTLIWGILVKLASGSHSSKVLSRHAPLLYSNQSSLPSLPVPKLNDTVSRYLKSVKPLLSEEEFRHQEQLAMDFKKNQGYLNWLLKLKSWIMPNYVTDWWEKYVYLMGRTPIVINSNYYILDSMAPLKTRCRAARAGKFISYAMKFKVLCETEQLEPIMIRNMVPMCMWQYERIFNTCRIPGKEEDTIETFSSGGTPYIVVIINGLYYRVDVADHDGSLFTCQELETQIRWIEMDAKRQPECSEAEKSIAALTTENRTAWYEAREECFSSGINKASLDLVEKSCFIVCLDDETFDTDKLDWETAWNGMAHSLFYGNGKNRWVDKSFNMVFFGDGRAGLHVEHAWADAPVVSHMFEWAVPIQEYNGKGYDENGSCLKEDYERPPRVRPPPRRIHWSMTPKLENAVNTALVHFKELASDIDLNVARHLDFGKGFIKKARVSPDAFVQMALQLAYKRNSGSFALTYESSMTRLYKHGRTETVRPCSIEAAAFVDAFDDSSMDAKSKMALMKKACGVHQDAYRLAMTGQGIDRHLFALYVASRGVGSKNTDFLNAALSMKWKLSTSQQPQNQTGQWDPSRNPEDAARISPGGGFGPVADDGYGVSYMVCGEDALFFHISSKKSSDCTDSKRFAKEISKALNDIKVMVEESLAA